MDYMVLTQRLRQLPTGDEEAEVSADVADTRSRRTMTALVVKDFSGEAVLVYPVQNKGLFNDRWIVGQIIEDLEALGLNGNVLAIKCDQEPSIVEVQDALIQKRAEVAGRRTLP